MAKLVFQGQRFEILESETVLECLLRHGISQPNSCRSGICQTCIMKLQSGSVPKMAQVGLKPNLQQQGYFLACICQPESDVEIVEADEVGFKSPAVLIAKSKLNNSINRYRWQLKDTFSFRAGQFIHIHAPQGIRSYSIASSSDEQEVELHVKRLANGKVSTWLETLEIGSEVELSGPLGECYYSPRDNKQNLLLVGTGSGLAPLWGILQDALAQDHQGEICLYHGSASKEGLYYEEELRGLAQLHPGFSYFPCLTREQNSAYTQGRLDEIIKSTLTDFKGWQVFLCGQAELVNKLKRQVYLAGASLDDIHADPFVFNPSE